MLLYCASRNDGLSLQSGGAEILYIGPSKAKAEEAIGGFKPYQMKSDPPVYTALPEHMVQEVIGFYCVDYWWASIVSFNVEGE